jgi:Zn-dependent protease
MAPGSGILLGRVLGVPVRLAPSWFVVAVVVVVLFAPSVERSTDLVAPATWGVAALFAVLLLGSVLLHEVAHAATARALGLPVTEIVANLWGGHTQFSDESPSPGSTALVAVAGPLANGGLTLAG